MMDQMLERLLAIQEKAQAEMRAKMKVDRKVDREEMISNQAKIEANMQEIVVEMKADRDAHVQEIVAKTVSAIEEKMEAAVHSIRSERDGKIQRRSKNVTKRQGIPKQGAAVASLECKELSPQEITERIEKTQAELQTVEVSLDTRTKKLEEKSEHQEIPKEKAAVKSSRITKKRHRGRRIAAGRRVKPTKLPRGDCESRKKLVVACMKVSCRAAAAWRKRNLVRDIRTQGNGVPRKELAATGRRRTRCTGIAQQKEHGPQKKDETRWHQEPGRKEHQGSSYF
jgi:hypothetical protein